MRNYELYTIGRVLEEDEYLLKIKDYEIGCQISSGFFTKLTQKNELPKAFDNWKFDINRPLSSTKLPVYVFKETFRKGWKLFNWRFGESQNWASLIHPEGFTIEIKLQNFLNIVKNDTIIGGELQSEYKWIYGDLIKKI